MINEKSFEDSAYSSRPDTEARINELTAEYDRSNEDLREALKDSPDIYEKKRSEWISAELGMDGEVEELNAMLENRTEDYFKSLIEETTGLKRREALYKDMDREIAKAFGLNDIKSMDDEELLEIIRTYSPDDLKDRDLNVMMGDMAYLSLANEGGHREGDQLLGRTGKALLKELKDASRHGGDEFTALIKLNNEEARKKIKYLERAVEEAPSTPTLTRYNLKPRLDIGLSHFSEGLKVFKQVVEEMEKTEKGKEKLSKLNTLKEFEDTWLEIADKRSMMKKAGERIRQLVELRDNDSSGSYESVIEFLRKGAYSIKDEEVDSIRERHEAGEKLDELAFEYVGKKEKENIGKKEGHDRIRAEIINDMLEKF